MPVLVGQPVRCVHVCCMRESSNPSLCECVCVCSVESKVLIMWPQTIMSEHYCLPPSTFLSCSVPELSELHLYAS